MQNKEKISAILLVAAILSILLLWPEYNYFKPGNCYQHKNNTIYINRIVDGYAYYNKIPNQNERGILRVVGIKKTEDTIYRKVECDK